MQKKVLFLTAFLILLTGAVHSQKWGYATLIAPSNGTSVTLLDTNSAVVKQWTNLSGQTAYSSYLTEGGNLWRTVKATNTSFMGGGICGKVQKIAWDGTLLFDYTVSDANQCSHHDICPLPNGNVMLIVYERKTAAEVQAAGATVNAVRWSEKIVELKPTGLNTADIVWEWHLWDHLVQNLYPAKANYQTSIVDHPELLNINYLNNMTDWVHMNGIDYNATLDQIVVSSHFLNELWVIDHSTTSAVAATHSGGNSGKGGDFLYRWGNPAAYQATGNAVFKVVHDAHWVPEDCPRAGWLGGFNNQGISNNTSCIDLFQPPWNGTGYTLTPGQAYTPPTYGYRHQTANYSSNMGSSQQLPNGNMLICAATAGKVYEINASGTQLWQYSSVSAIPQAKRYSRCFIENPKVAVASIAPTICSGGSVQLDITPSATNVTSFSYNWASASGLSGTAIQDPVVSGITDTTVYYVTVTSSPGCIATASVTVAVLPAPAAHAGDDQNIELGQAAALVAGGGASYLWSTGATTAAISVAPLSTTTYSVTVTDSNGCTATDDVVVAVFNPVVVQASATTTAFCAGGSTQLSVAATGGTGNFSYLWTSNPPGFTSTLPNPVVSPTQNTQYTIVVSDLASSAQTVVDITVFPLPDASAGNDTSILIGTPATLSASGGTTYTWSTTENTPSIEVSPSFTTTYFVTVTNSDGCSATDHVTVTVTGSLLSMVVSASESVLCTGQSTALSAIASGGTGNYVYEWSANGEVISNAQNPVVSPGENTVYTVRIHDGINEITDGISIQVNPLPTVDAGADTTIYIGQSTVLTATGGALFFWNTGESDPVINVAPVENTVFIVTATDANGCAASDSVTVYVNTVLPLTGSIAASDSVICLGDVTQLFAYAANGTNSYTYSWSSTPPGFASSLFNPYINPEENTIYHVDLSDGASTIHLDLAIQVNPLADQPIITVSGDSLISSSPDNNQWFYYGNPIPGATGQVLLPLEDGSYQVQTTSANGCFSPLSEPVEYFIPLPLAGAVSASDTVICLGDVIQLFATGVEGTGNYSYSWTSTPAGFVSNLFNPYVNPEENTTYAVEISDGVSSISLMLDITVNQLAAQPTITVSGDSLISSSPTGNQWFYYGNPIPGATGQVYVTTEAGSYQVQVVDANGCLSLFSEPVEIIAVSVTQAGLEEHWKLAPNPVADWLTLSGDFAQQAFSIELWDTAGRLRMNVFNNTTLSLKEIPAGLYLLQLHTPKGTGIRKVVVIK